MKTFKELREFNFNKAVKRGYLEKSDKPMFDKLMKTHKVISFVVSGDGYEFKIKHKKTGQTCDFVGKNPQDVLKQAHDKWCKP